MKEFVWAYGVCNEFADTWRVDIGWVWNLDLLKLMMFSGKEKVLFRILYIVQSLRK